MKILFVNGCPRPNSRTLELAKAVLDKMQGSVEEVRLFEEVPQPLTWESLSLRDELVEQRNFNHPMFDMARQFAGADRIVIAAPYWDMMFPAAVRSYFEGITVSGVTFFYGEDGIPRGLCKAESLIYVTTAGGPVMRDFGFEYIEALARDFFEISEVRCIRAEGLDIWGADIASIMEDAKKNIFL